MTAKLMMCAHETMDGRHKIFLRYPCGKVNYHDIRAGAGGGSALMLDSTER
jgi:hypothetical protein